MIDHIIAERAQAIILEVGKYMAAEQHWLLAGQVETKSLNSLVSYVDKTAEERLVAGLGPLIPGSVFLTEEATVMSREGEWQWIIDPLDGTTNFIHGLPVFAISVALRHHNDIVWGMVHLPVLDETFSAIKGQGAMLNGKKITVSENTILADSLLATGFPYYDFHHIDNYFRTLRYFVENTRGVRRMGSAAIDLCYTACGRFDGFFEYSLSPWDVAAGGLIVQEAGGLVKDFDGSDNWLFGKEIVAGNPVIAGEILGILT